MHTSCSAALPRGLPVLAASEDVEVHGADDDDAGDGDLSLLWDPHQSQTVGQHRDDEGADDGARDGQHVNTVITADTWP